MATLLQNAVAAIRVDDYATRMSIVDSVLMKLMVLPSRSHHGGRV